MTIAGMEPGGPLVVARGATLEAAIESAREKWATEHVLPLMWADGTPVEGLARQVLIEALELFELQVGASAELKAMVATMKRALGAEEG